MARVSRLQRKLRRKSSVMDVDITSLLDILVILIVFLLKSYDSSSVIVNVAENITLPFSETKTINSAGVTIQVSADKVWVEDQMVMSIDDPTSQKTDQGGRRYISIFNELVKRKEAVKTVEKLIDEEKRFTGKVNLIIDKSIKYSQVKKILYTCAEAGFLKYNFIVKRIDE